MSLRFVALDCETTGFVPESDRIIEVGMRTFTLALDGAPFDEFTNPGVRVPSVVAKLTGISDAMLTDAPTFAEIRPRVADFTTDAILVGHNLVFDLNFLAKNGVDRSMAPQLDTYLIASFILPRVATLSLAGLADLFGITHEAAHRAGSDAAATRDLLRVLIGLAREFPREKWAAIQQLNTTEPTWLTTFADVILADEPLDAPTIERIAVWKTKQSTYPPRQRLTANTAERSEQEDSVIQLLAAPEPTQMTLLEQTSNSESHARLVETHLSAADVLTTRLPSTIAPLTLALSGNFTARTLAHEYDVPLVLAPRYYADQEKITRYAALPLSATQASFIAKLILHDALNYFEFNLTRAERLDWDFVEAEVLPTPVAAALADAPVVITNHDSLPELARIEHPQNERTTPDSAHDSFLLPSEGVGGWSHRDRHTLIFDATALPDSLAKADGLTIDLPTLEKLVPTKREQIAVWWGLLGILLRTAGPLYGYVDLAVTTGLAEYVRVRDAGMHLLAELGSALPRRVREKLAIYLAETPGYVRKIRTDASGAITLMLERLPDPAVAGALVEKLQNVTLVDSALATQPDDFTYARRLLGLPLDTSTTTIPDARVAPLTLALIPGLPLPADPDAEKILSAKLVEILNTRDGLTSVLFTSRYQMSNFFEAHQAAITRPLKAEKISGSAGKLALELKTISDGAYLTTTAKFPARTATLVITRLPFTMKDGADWKTETLPAALLAWRRIFQAITCVADRPAEQTVICLDNRLTEKGYGKEFLAAVGLTPVRL